MSASEHSAQSNGGSCRLIYARTRDGGNRKSFSYFISLLKGSKLKDITACRHDYLPGSNIRFFLFRGSWCCLALQIPGLPPHCAHAEQLTRERAAGFGRGSSLSKTDIDQL